MADFSENYRMGWKEWELRCSVLFSLFLQIFLTLCAPLRRRGKFKWLSSFIWLAYLMADWVAAFALGMFSNTLRATHSSSSPHSIGKADHNPPSSSFSSIHCTQAAEDRNRELIAFWAPFLLAHLGGPDTITAFALEDNELWLRHLLTLLVHLGSALYVVLPTFHSNHLILPTLLVFIVGIIRYAERTRALYRASNLGLHRSFPAPPDPGTDYARLTDVYTTKRNMGIPAVISFPEEPLLGGGGGRVEDQDEEGSRGIALVTSAHGYFATFKRLFLDHLILWSEGEKSRDDFKKLKHDQGFAIMEVELGLLYDIRYTKAPIVYTRQGYITRALCFACILVAAALFIFKDDKCGYHRDDEAITLALLMGAVLMDVIGFIHLLFSDWTIPSFSKKKNDIIFWLVSRSRRKYKQAPKTYVSQYNLISFCLRRSKKTTRIWMWLLNRPLMGDFLEKLFFTKNKEVDQGMKKFIFEELQEKAKNTTNVKKTKDLASCTGTLEGLSKLSWFEDVEFEEKVLLWHIVTEVCHRYTKKEKGQPNSNRSTETEKEEPNIYPNSYGSMEKESESYRKFSKRMSDYMHYLFVFKPTMIASLEGIRQTKYQEAFAQAKSFIDYHLRDPKMHTEKEFCKKLFEQELPFEEGRTQFVLFDALLIVKRLMPAETSTESNYLSMWKRISKMWVELVCHAATHCSAKNHTEQLVLGGELLTTVWLMMAHMGISERYRGEYSHSKAKLVVGK